MQNHPNISQLCSLLNLSQSKQHIHLNKLSSDFTSSFASRLQHYTTLQLCFSCSLPCKLRPALQNLNNIQQRSTRTY